jgi:hypothetical protein
MPGATNRTIHQHADRDNFFQAARANKLTTETYTNTARNSSCSGRAAEPLSLAELVRLIDGSNHPDLSAEPALGYNNVNADGGVTARHELRDFTTKFSEIYQSAERRGLLMERV